MSEYTSWPSFLPRLSNFVVGRSLINLDAVTFLNDSGASISATSTTGNSATQLTVVIPKSSLPNSGEPYDVVITNLNGLAVTGANQINIDASPAFVTAAAPTPPHPSPPLHLPRPIPPPTPQRLRM